MAVGAIGANVDKALEITENKKEKFVKTGEFQKLDFTPIPHNGNYEADLHRPYIDEIEFNCKCGGKMKRVSDVLDTWFDSGSMPYAQAHYPFENKKNLKLIFRRNLSPREWTKRAHGFIICILLPRLLKILGRLIM